MTTVVLCFSLYIVQLKADCLQIHWDACSGRDGGRGYEGGREVGRGVESKKKRREGQTILLVTTDGKRVPKGSQKMFKE